MAKLPWWHQQYIRLVASAIWANERIFFYPKLSAFYRRTLRKDPLILDVGANKGQSINFFMGLFPAARIHAFEPNHSLFKQLLQRFTSSNVKLHPLAASNISGEKTFYQSVLDETSSLEKVDTNSSYMKLKSRVLLTSPDKLVADSYNVQVITLDAFIQSQAIGTIDLIKIDVEGHEPAVLQGLEQSLRNHAIQFIQLEEHHDDQYADSSQLCNDLLIEAGYSEIFRLKHGFGNFYEVVFGKNN